MKHRRNEIALVAGGILLGATLAAPVAGAALTAQESMQQIYVDGKLTQMEAYSISGHNYCKLRDIGQAVGFAVDYDPATNTVQIRTSENTTAHTSEAHRLSFGSGYTAGAYAALREAMRSGSATIVASAEERTALMNAVAAIGSYPAYDVSDDSDTVTVYAKHPSAYAEAAEICRRFIGGLAGQSDGDKATAMANYVCDRLAYDANSTATPRTLFASDGVKKGNCMSYAHGFQFLCNLADIPCILVHNSPRQGFNKRPPKPEVQLLYDGLKGFCFNEMLEVVKDLIADTEKPVSVSHFSAADRQALATFSEDDYERILNTTDPTAEIERKPGIVNRRIFNREIPRSLKALYHYRCQICGATATIMYGVDVSEAHHIKPFTESMDNSPQNIAVLCPDHHRIVHRAKAVFDREKCQFVYETAKADSLMLNLHL